jgi:hypothetical protein
MLGLLLCFTAFFSLQVEGMKVWKIKQYLPTLLLYVQRRVGSERGFLVAVRTRDICGVDRRCVHILKNNS